MIVHIKTTYKIAIMGKLSLVIIKGIEYEGIMKSGSYCSLMNIPCVGSKFIDRVNTEPAKLFSTLHNFDFSYFANFRLANMVTVYVCFLTQIQRHSY